MNAAEKLRNKKRAGRKFYRKVGKQKWSRNSSGKKCSVSFAMRLHTSKVGGAKNWTEKSR